MAQRQGKSGLPLAAPP
jgi:chromosome segregation ATPase